MRWLVDGAYPHAKVVRLVLDNLNTHKLGSLYEAFGASEARRIAKRLEFHPHSHTRKLAEHGRDRVERLQQAVSEPPDRR